MHKFDFKEVTEPKRVITGGTCDSCGAIPDGDTWGSAMPEHGVIITIQGGYNAYFDDHDLRFMFCDICFAKLQKAFKCISDAVDDVAP